MPDYLSVALSVLAAFQLLFVALYLFFHPQGNKRNNYILGLIFLLFAISMTDVTIRMMGIEISIPALHFIDDGFLFLYGPLLYFYTNSVVYSDYGFKLKHLFHFIPFILFLGSLVIDIISLNQSDQAEAVYQILSAELPIWIIFASITIYLYLLSYLWFCNKSIRIYRMEVKDKFSSIDDVNLNWLSFIVRSFAAITVIAMINSAIPIFRNVFFHYVSLILLLIVTFLFINRVLVRALNQPEIFSGIKMKGREKYAGSNLGSHEIENYKIRLSELMEKEKLYLNPQLTLKDLADRLQVSSKTLSQVINQSFNQNFFDLINSYRCDEVKNIFSGTTDSKITISEVMFQSGFNSKSSFNKEFKKITGKTPSEFKKSIGK